MCLCRLSLYLTANQELVRPRKKGGRKQQDHVVSLFLNESAIQCQDFFVHGQPLALESPYGYLAPYCLNCLRESDSILLTHNPDPVSACFSLFGQLITSRCWLERSRIDFTPQGLSKSAQYNAGGLETHTCPCVCLWISKHTKKLKNVKIYMIYLALLGEF